MNILKVCPGRILVELTSAAMPGLLNAINAAGISLQKIVCVDDLTVCVLVSRCDYNELASLSAKHGARAKKIKNIGAFTVAGRFIKRPVLTVFFFLLIVLSCYIPSRVFFLRVEGNADVPEAYILEIAEECGIRFGVKRRMLRSEKMKNALLERIPQLQWAGINTTGCTAVISVREKTDSEGEVRPQHKVSSIAALRDGIIQSCTVREGSALCSVGQAVKAGQVLVTGYLDFGIVIKTTQAEAEIQALTFRDLEVLSPYATIVKGAEQKDKTKYGLRIGKKLIKFYKDSGNLDTTCGKIYAEEYIYLPGGFRLPVAIVRETEFSYDADRGEVPVADTGAWLQDFANIHLNQLMISGEIISADTEVVPGEGVFYLRGRYACSEMIGQVIYEEFIPKDDE